MLRNKARVWAFIFAGFLFASACTEELFDAQSATAPFTIINSAHNIGKNVSNAAQNYVQLLSFARNSDDTYTYYDATRILDNQGDYYGALTRTTIDQNGALQSFNILKRQRELKGETGAPVVDPTIFDTPKLSYALDNVSTNPFLSYVRFYEANYVNNTLRVGAQANFNCELRFGPGKTQKAHRFMSAPAIGPIGNWNSQLTYQDYVDVPFEAWDVTNNRQLMVSFRDMQRDGEFTLVPFNTWGNPPNEAQSREYLAISDIEYSTTPDDGIIADAEFAFFSAYFIWPLLTDGATWNPTALPDSKLVITRSESDHYEFYPIPLAGEANFSVNTTLDRVALLSVSSSSPTGPLKSLALLDASLAATGKGIKDGLFGDFFGVLATSDGGAIACFSMGYINPYQLTKIVKIKNDLSVDFEISFSLNELGLQDYYFENPMGATIHFLEKDGQYFFFSYNVNRAGPDVIKVFRVDASGLVEISNTIAPEIDNLDFYFKSGIQDLVAYSDGYALITHFGNVYFFDGEFKPVKGMVSLPGLKEGLLYRTYHLYPAQTGVYFSGSTVDNPKGALEDCNNCPEQVEAAVKPKLSVGFVDKNGGIKRRVIDLGGRIFQCRSVFNEDGTAAHIALVETSPRARDLVFFKSDKDFNIIK